MRNIEIGPLRIEGGNRVFVNGHEVWLAHDEHRLLLHVAGRPGQVCLRQDLIGRGWRVEEEGRLRRSKETAVEDEPTREDQQDKQGQEEEKCPFAEAG